VLVTYEFCGAALCSVAVDATRTDDEDILLREYDQLLEFTRGSLGAPISSARRIGPGCRGHLPLCLTSRQSQINARWSWPNGPQVELSVDQLEGRQGRWSETDRGVSACLHQLGSEAVAKY
jgi:hypothetical protein